MVAASVDDGGAIVAVPVGEDNVQRVEESPGAVGAAVVDEGGALVAAPD